MAMFRSFKTLIPKYRTLLASSSTISSTPFPSPPLSSLLTHHHLILLSYSRYPLSPISKWIIPLSGPLFLTFPPWKLSQSATPLYLQGDVASSKKVEALHLLRDRRFPLRLGVDSTSSSAGFSSNRVDSKELIDGSGSFVDSFVNLPNMVSMSRMISGPVIGWMIANEWYSSAFLALGISGATDWLDGYIARKMNINSVVGSYLDPLADKVLIGCVALAMVHKDLLHSGLVGLVVLRDVALVGGAVYMRASSLGWKWKTWYDFFNLNGTSPQKVEPLFISKVNTVLQLILVAGALLQPVYGTDETQLYIAYLSWLVASTTVGSTAAYGVQHMRNKTISITRSH